MLFALNRHMQLSKYENEITTKRRVTMWHRKSGMTPLPIMTILALVLTASFASAQNKKPNILVIMGDDIGWYNTSIYNRGDMGYQTPNIDRIGKEGGLFLSWYGQQSCTSGRAAFITGQSPIRTGLTKVGLPGADLGLGPK